MLKILSVCGTRPNFMKIAALARAFAKRPEIHGYLVHTGQHYDEAMNQRFFDELEIPRPDVNLEVGSGSQAWQTAEIMQRIEPVILEQRPTAVLVVGDVNSTMAGALVAVKLHIPVVHVEAGLRSSDRRMPEEINRLVTDAISDLLFVSEPSGVRNLKREGVDPARIHFVGNVMIDTLRAHQRLAESSDVLARLGLRPREYAAMTMHRPDNVDDPRRFGRLCDVLEQVQRTHAVVFPLHPRTRANLERSGLGARLAALPRVKLVDPLGYLDFVKLMSCAAFVMTDSGGVQEETTVLGVPCLTLRDNTERPVTVDEGTNQLVGMDPARILAGYERVLGDLRSGRAAEPRVPELWDGRAAERIAEILLRELG